MRDGIQTNFEGHLRTLELKVEPLQRFIHVFAATLTEPVRYQSGKTHRGFRYVQPDVRHFCLLKAIRAVSSFNAALVLARSGYTQEIVVLMRILLECTTHIDFVLIDYDHNHPGNLKPEAKKYVSDYFDDSARTGVADFSRPQMRQGKVHKAVGADLDKFLKETGHASEFSEIQSEKRLSNIYFTLSNYVHARYPEGMDLYGGVPPRFHLHGMSGTPKDGENLVTLETLITTLSNALQIMVVKFRMHDLIGADAVLTEWYRSR